MSGRRGVAWVLVAAAAGLVVGVVLVGREQGGVPPPRRTMSIQIAVSPRVHVFGDPVVAAVALEFDKRRVNPDTIRIDAVFRPYEQLGAPGRTRTDVGDVVRLRYRYRLGCFSQACLPGTDKREFDLSPLRVVYSLRQIRGRVSDSAEWPPFDVATRLGPFDAQQARWRADLDPPAVTYRLSPAWLAALLLGGSLLCLAAAGALGAFVLSRRAGDAVAEAATGPQPSPLERALDLVARESRNGSAPDRRRALERLARELGRVDRPDLAARARRLAWSPGEPVPADVVAFAEEVRDSVDGGR